MCDWKMASLFFLQVVISCSIFGVSLLVQSQGGGGMDAKMAHTPKGLDVTLTEYNEGVASRLITGSDRVPKYQLVYFNRQGRAEITRWAFAYGGIEFENIRVEGPEWPTLKNQVPNGQLPYLQVEGKTNLSESMAIARFAARKGGLVGKNDLEAAQAGKWTFSLLYQ